jgi:hypothetical protein
MEVLTYLKTIRAKVFMFGIKPKLMKCRFMLTYFYDLLTYLKTIRAKVVMFGIKPKLMNCRFELAYFNDLLTYLTTIRAKVVMFGINPKLIMTMTRHLWEIFLVKCQKQAFSFNKKEAKVYCYAFLHVLKSDTCIKHEKTIIKKLKIFCLLHAGGAHVLAQQAKMPWPEPCL